MTRLFVSVLGILILVAGCGQVTEQPVQLESQRIDYCDFDGDPIKQSGRIVAESAANCRFIRDGRDSGRAVGYLQKSVFNTQTQSYQWRTVSNGAAQTWTLPSNVEVGWHFFGVLKAYGACQSGAYRSATIVTWPKDGTNQILWAGRGVQINC